MAKRRDWSKIQGMVSKIKELGLSYKEGAERFGVKPHTLYNYNKRVAPRLEGAGKSPGSKSKGNSGKHKKERANRLPEEVKELIRSYRRKHPGHGFKRIEDHLKQRYLLVVRRKQIRGVLKEAGLLGDLDSSFDRQGSKGSRRFEARYPCELYQMDVIYVYIQKLPVLYLACVIG